jgi:hypothetical protein
MGDSVVCVVERTGGMDVLMGCIEVVGSVVVEVVRRERVRCLWSVIGCVLCCSSNVVVACGSHQVFVWCTH